MTQAVDRGLPLLLLPGTLCDAHLFTDLLARLDVDAMVFPLEGGDDPAGVARHILMAAPPRFNLLGFSLGGVVALEIAAQAPGRVTGIALLDSNARAVPKAAHRARRAAADGAIRDVIDRLWPNYVGRRRRNDERLHARIAAMAEALGPEVLARQTEMALARRDSLGRLASLLMPALILAGSEDALSPPAMQREMAERLPDAALALIEQAGHFTLLEAPDEVAEHVSNWLERADAFAAHQAMLSPSTSCLQEVP